MCVGFYLCMYGDYLFSVVNVVLSCDFINLIVVFGFFFDVCRNSEFIFFNVLNI